MLFVWFLVGSIGIMLYVVTVLICECVVCYNCVAVELRVNEYVRGLCVSCVLVVVGIGGCVVLTLYVLMCLCGGYVWVCMRVSIWYIYWCVW